MLTIKEKKLKKRLTNKFTIKRANTGDFSSVEETHLPAKNSIKHIAPSKIHTFPNKERINQLLGTNSENSEIEFIEKLFEYFNINYSLNNEDLKKIPEHGPILIIANHSTELLDSLCLIKVVGEIRNDIKIVADGMLLNFNALKPILIPAETVKSNSQKEITKALDNQNAVIIFPAKSLRSGKISKGIDRSLKKRYWKNDFIHLSRQLKVPLLPVLIEARKSIILNIFSLLLKPFGYYPLTNESIGLIDFYIGNPISFNKLINNKLSDQHLTKRIRKHLYKLKKDSNRTFITEKPLASPERKNRLMKALSSTKKLGETRDQNTIYIADYHKNSPIIKEIGRLREYTFRQVGEGTGASRDLDRYDKYYKHLTLWHKKNQQIVGAYRIGEAGKLIADKGVNSLYTASLYQFSDAAMPFLTKSLELGRSFVHPDFWGKASLDYLWQGIGAFIRHNHNVRYVIGPVSMSADYPKDLSDELVFYFQKYYQTDTTLALAYNPYLINLQKQQRLQIIYDSLDASEGLELLQKNFKKKGFKIPVLFKQYISLYEKGGIKLLAFSIDPDFGNCIDGLLLGDLQKLKKKKRARYIGNNL